MFSAVILRPATQLTPRCLVSSAGGSAIVTPIVIVAATVIQRVLVYMSGSTVRQTRMFPRQENETSSNE